jgi:ribosomal protein L11 methyltransferase
LKPTVQPSITRIDVLAAKGTEELIPEELYRLSNPGIWIEELDGDVLIRCYPEKTDQFLDLLQASGISVKEVLVHQEDAVDYSTLTRKYFRPIRIEDVTVLPPWSTARGEGRRIIIEPGMAFGTGRHESTRIMIKLMKMVDMEGKNLLDLGCGSGILSLYGHILGAVQVTAVDNDTDAIYSARKNLGLNNADKIRLICASLEDVKGSYDVVLANLDIRTFIRYAEVVLNLVRENGYLVVSGILTKERRDLTRLFDPVLPVMTVRKNSWCGFIFKIDNDLSVR